MTRDAIDLLRAADPVPQPVAYAESDVSDRIAEILASDGELPASIGGGPLRRTTRSRWVPAGLVAAAVLVLAVVSAVVFTGGHGDKDAAGAAPVTCAVSSGGGANVVRARLAQAKQVITVRVRQSNGSAHSFVSSLSDATIGFTPHRVSVRTAARACRATSIAIHPVVAPPVPLDAHAPRSAKPLTGLTFSVPTTDAAYARLTAPQRTRLAAAMSHFDCTPMAATTAVGLGCSTVPGSTQVVLLGPVLITGSDVSSARAVAPDTGKGGGQVDWTVDLAFRAAGAARFEAFTAAHHTSSTSTSLSTCGTDGSVSCADFLAITVGGRIQTIPETSATLGSVLSISGGFDQAQAQDLAADYAAASAQLHPR